MITKMKKQFLKITTLLLGVLCSCSNEHELIPQERAPYLNVSDSLAVVDLWKKADGPNWLVKWDLKDITTWGGAGIRLDKEKNEYRIVYLNMNGSAESNAKGYLSESIGDLPELDMFYLAGSGISGQIPQSLSKLEKLRILVIKGTSIADTLPKFLFQYPEIEQLEIAGNPLIHGKLPDEIKEIPPKMYLFGLYGNNLSGRIPDGIKFHGRLILRLDKNSFSEIPFSYCQNTKFRISVKENKITGVIPDSILQNPGSMLQLRSMTYKQKPGYGFENAPDDWK